MIKNISKNVSEHWFFNSTPHFYRHYAGYAEAVVLTGRWIAFWNNQHGLVIAEEIKIKQLTYNKPHRLAKRKLTNTTLH